MEENKEHVSNELSDISVENLIYIIRGKQVMLDSDLAILYQVETKRINESVKRNKKRFPEDFCFQLTEEEYNALKCQFGISNIKEKKDSMRSHVATSNENEVSDCIKLQSVSTKGGRRYLPYVFTEQGIAMLSAVLRSEVAIQVSIKIMNTFVEMRRFLNNNALMFERMNQIELKQLEYQKSTDEKFDKVFDYISEHEEKGQSIFFDGQIYDAFSFLVSIVEKAEKTIILVDNYVDVDTLNILAKKRAKVDASIYTVKKTRLTAKDVEKFNLQYPTLKLKYTGVFHDRFLIIDREAAYHIGASIKDAGKKCFGISLIEDKRIVGDILTRLELETEEKLEKKGE